MTPPPNRRPSALRLAGPMLALALVACGGNLRSGTFRGYPDDAATGTAGDDAGATAVASSPSDDASASSSVAIDGATPPLVPVQDPSLPGPPSLGDGGIDPNGPCPTDIASLQCSVEGAHLCGGVCSLQCVCAGGLWACHLPPC
jgi:hypothetical protein